MWLTGQTTPARYGYLGVDLFFLISGFVILWSVQGRDASEFVVSRIGRLYPSFWAAMLLTTAVILLLGPSVASLDFGPISLQRLAANATMMPQIFDQPRIDGVYWTLEVEIRFYFLVFIALLLGLVERVERWLYAWLAVSLASLMWTLPEVVQFLSVGPHAGLFIGGCLLFLVHSKGWSKGRAIGLLVSTGLAMFHATVGRGQFITPDSESAVVVPLLVLACFITVFLALSWNVSAGSAHVAYRLGALTYPLYLTHAVIGKISIGFLLPLVGASFALILTVLAVLSLAQILVVSVDGPGRRMLTKACNRARLWVKNRIYNYGTA